VVWNFTLADEHGLLKLDAVMATVTKRRSGCAANLHFMLGADGAGHAMLRRRTPPKISSRGLVCLGIITI